MCARVVLGNEPDSLDYSVHGAWNEATNNYLLLIVVSFLLLMYARKNKRKIVQIFALPPNVGSSPKPNFYNSLPATAAGDVLSGKFELQQSQTESVQLSVE